MRLKINIEEGVILLFCVSVLGYTKPVLEVMLDKVWLNHRWTGRFYYSVSDRCHKFIVNVSTFNRKECVYKHDFIKILKGLTPKGKKVIIE